MNGNDLETIAVIRALSDRGAELFQSELGWMNPLPRTVGDLFAKINYGLKQSEYIEGVTGDSQTSLANLAALKLELEGAIERIAASPNTSLQARRP